MKLSFGWFLENYYEPDHPRVLKGYPTAGQWLQKPKFLALPPPRVKAPEVIKTSGDVWSQETALRLQREFEAVDDHLGEMAEKLVGKSETFSTVPTDWDDLPSNQQEETYNKWKENHWGKSVV